MNNTESVGAVKTTSVAGDANLMITGKLMEMIEGDLISETKSERTTISDGKVSNQSKEEFEIHSQKQIKKNNAEYGTNH